MLAENPSVKGAMVAGVPARDISLWHPGGVRGGGVRLVDRMDACVETLEDGEGDAVVGDELADERIGSRLWSIGPR